MTCGGCEGLGNHGRLCPRNPNYTHFLRLQVMAESIGDSVGDPPLANQAWALAGELARKHEVALDLKRRRRLQSAPVEDVHLPD